MIFTNYIWADLNILPYQGLNDPEEFVIQKAICAITAMTELGLIQKVMTRELLSDVVKFLCHPVSVLFLPMNDFQGRSVYN